MGMAGPAPSWRGRTSPTGPAGSQWQGISTGISCLKPPAAVSAPDGQAGVYVAVLTWTGSAARSGAARDRAGETAYV